MGERKQGYCPTTGHATTGPAVPSLAIVPFIGVCHDRLVALIVLGASVHNPLAGFLSSIPIGTATRSAPSQPRPPPVGWCWHRPRPEMMDLGRRLS